jgi:hypothetical protein
MTRQVLRSLAATLFALMIGLGMALPASLAPAEAAETGDVVVTATMPAYLMVTFPDDVDFGTLPFPDVDRVFRADLTFVVKSNLPYSTVIASVTDESTGGMFLYNNPAYALSYYLTPKGVYPVAVQQLGPLGTNYDANVGESEGTLGTTHTHELLFIMRSTDPPALPGMLDVTIVFRVSQI